MRSDDDGGQMLLLAGILLVLAFILLSLQLAKYATLGQQAGRELDHPLTDDYELLRRTTATFAMDELRDSSNAIICPPDLVMYKEKIVAFLETARAYEQNRGQVLQFSVISVTAPTATSVSIDIELTLGDDVTFITDDLTYEFGCT